VVSTTDNANNPAAKSAIVVTPSFLFQTKNKSIGGERLSGKK